MNAPNASIKETRAIYVYEMTPRNAFCPIINNNCMPIFFSSNRKENKKIIQNEKMKMKTKKQHFIYDRSGCCSFGWFSVSLDAWPARFFRRRFFLAAALLVFVPALDPSFLSSAERWLLELYCIGCSPLLGGGLLPSSPSDELVVCKTTLRTPFTSITCSVILPLRAGPGCL